MSMSIGNQEVDQIQLAVFDNIPTDRQEDRFNEIEAWRNISELNKCHNSYVLLFILLKLSIQVTQGDVQQVKQMLAIFKSRKITFTQKNVITV